MWCSSCQQDVPGIASPNGVMAVGCARCGAGLTLETRERSSIDLVERDHLSSSSPERCIPEKVASCSASADAPPSVEWECFDWDDELQHAECVLQELRALREVDPRPSGDTHTETNSHGWQATSPNGRRHRGMRQRRFGWFLTIWGMGSTAPSGLWTAWFVFQNDALWAFGATATLVSLLILSFGFVLVLHAHARQTEAIAGILQFAVHELSELRATLVGSGPTTPHEASPFPDNHRDRWAA